METNTPKETNKVFHKGPWKLLVGCFPGAWSLRCYSGLMIKSHTFSCVLWVFRFGCFTAFPCYGLEYKFRVNPVLLQSKSRQYTEVFPGTIFLQQRFRTKKNIIVFLFLGPCTLMKTIFTLTLHLDGLYIFALEAWSLWYYSGWMIKSHTFSCVLWVFRFGCFTAFPCYGLEYKFRVNPVLLQSKSWQYTKVFPGNISLRQPIQTESNVARLFFLCTPKKFYFFPFQKCYTPEYMRHKPQTKKLLRFWAEDSSLFLLCGAWRNKKALPISLFHLICFLSRTLCK